MNQRFDNYQWIHKAVRHQITRVLQQLSTTDWADVGECHQALDAVDTALNSQVDHTRHEETYYHPMLESRIPGSTASFSAHHHEIEGRIEAMKKATALLRKKGNVEEAAGFGLYLAFCRFSADYLVHLDEEEAELKPLFLKHFSESDLLNLQSRVVADISPEEMRVIIPHFLAALDRAELVAWLTQIQQSAPAEVFADICNAAIPIVTHRTWKKVTAALGLGMSS